jgi:hypothetical protein
MRSVLLRGKKKTTNKYTSFFKRARMKSNSNINREMWDIVIVEHATDDGRKIELQA